MGSVAETPVGLSGSLMGVSVRVLVCVQFWLWTPWAADTVRVGALPLPQVDLVVFLWVLCTGRGFRLCVSSPFSPSPALHPELYLPNLLSCLQELWCFSPFIMELRTSASLFPRNPF